MAHTREYRQKQFYRQQHRAYTQAVVNFARTGRLAVRHRCQIDELTPASDPRVGTLLESVRRALQVVGARQPDWRAYFPEVHVWFGPLPFRRAATTIEEQLLLSHPTLEAGLALLEAWPNDLASCPHCRHWFLVIRSKQKYCSPSCLEAVKAMRSRAADMARSRAHRKREYAKALTRARRGC